MTRKPTRRMFPSLRRRWSVSAGAPLVRGGRMETLEGEGRKRNVVIAFRELRTGAPLSYHSPDYQAAVALRAPVAEADVVVVEGLD